MEGAGRAPTPKSDTKPQPGQPGILVPQEIADSLCTSYHYVCTYFSTDFFSVQQEFQYPVFTDTWKKNLVFLLMSLSSFYEWMDNTGVTVPH